MNDHDRILFQHIANTVEGVRNVLWLILIVLVFTLTSLPAKIGEFALGLLALFGVVLAAPQFHAMVAVLITVAVAIGLSWWLFTTLRHIWRLFHGRESLGPSPYREDDQ